MRIEKDNIVIRSANLKDAEILNRWWNDGSVMEHAGFPNGLGQSMEETIECVKSNEGRISQLCIIEIYGKPVGELSYSITGNDTGSTLFDFIFTDEKINSVCKVNKIEWDTMLENKRAQHVYENKIKAVKKDVLENNWKDQLGNWRTAVVYEISREKFYKN